MADAHPFLKPTTDDAWDMIIDGPTKTTRAQRMEAIHASADAQAEKVVEQMRTGGLRYSPEIGFYTEQKVSVPLG